MKTVHYYLNRQQQRRDVALFTPNFDGTQGTRMTLPANGRLVVRAEADAAFGDTCLVQYRPEGDRPFGVPAMVAGDYHTVGFFPRNAEVQVQAGFTLLLDCGLGIYKPIGEPD